MDRWASLEDVLTHQVFSCFFDVGLCVFLGEGGGQGKPNTWILRVFERFSGALLPTFVSAWSFQVSAHFPHF